MYQNVPIAVAVKSGAKAEIAVAHRFNKIRGIREVGVRVAAAKVGKNVGFHTRCGWTSWNLNV